MPPDELIDNIDFDEFDEHYVDIEDYINGLEEDRGLEFDTTIDYYDHHTGDGYETADYGGFDDRIESKKILEEDNDADSILNSIEEKASEVSDGFFGFRVAYDLEAGLAVDEIETQGIAVRDSSIEHVEEIRAGEVALESHRPKSKLRLENRDVEIDGEGRPLAHSVGTIEAVEAAVKGYKIIEADEVVSHKADAIVDSIVGEIGKISSGKEEPEDIGYGNVAVRDSELLQVDHIESKGKAAVNSDIGLVGVVKAEDDAFNDTRVAEAKYIEAGATGFNGGSSRERLGWAGAVNADKIGIENATIGVVKNVDAGRVGIKEVAGGRITNVTAESNGIMDSDLDRVGVVNASNGNGIVGSNIEEVGEVVAGRNCIDYSDITFVGSVTSKYGTAIKNANIDEVSGDITAEEDAIRANIRDVGRVFGNIYVGENVLHSADFTYVVADEIEGERLAKEVSSAFVAASSIDVEERGSDIFAITAQEDDEFATYDGDDWNAFATQLRDNYDEFHALRYLRPDIDSVSSFEELVAIEEDLRNIADTDLSEVRHHAEDFKPFLTNLPGQEAAQILGKFQDELERVKKKDAAEFGQIIDRLEEEYVETLIERLDTDDDHKIGNDIFNLGKKSKYRDIIDSKDEREEELRSILEAKGELPDIDSMVEESPYARVLKSLYFDMREDVRVVTGLADYMGEEVTFDVEKLLKKWGGQRQHTGEERDIDYHDLLDRFEDELESKKRAYTISAVSHMGEHKVKGLYEELTGEKPDEFDELDVDVIRAYQKNNRNYEAMRKLLEKGNEVYEELEENKRWLSGLEEEEGITLEDLTQYEVKMDTSDLTLDNFQKQKECRLEEMKDCLDDLNEELGTEFEASTYEEMREVKEEIDDEDIPRLYDRFSNMVDTFESLLGRNESLPDEITVRVADPRETIRMGEYFTGSCLAVDKMNGWSAATNAIDANKQVLYVEDEEGDVIGRVMTGITREYDVASFSKFRNIDANLTSYMDEAVEQYASELGLEHVGEDKNIELLEGEKWYSSQI